MRVNRTALKRFVKRRLKETRYKPLLVSVIALALLYLLNLFIYNLSGYMAFTQAFSQALQAFRNGEAMVVPGWPGVSPVAILLVVSLLIMRLLVEAGYMGYCLRVTRGLDCGTKNLFDAFNFSAKALLVQLFRAGIVLLYALPAIAMAILGIYLFRFGGGWTLLCLLAAAGLSIPSFIISYTYRQAVYAMFDDESLSARDCMRASKALMIGNRKELLMLDLSFVGWQLLSSFMAMLTIPLVDLWIVPYLNLSYAEFYDDVKQDAEKRAAREASARERAKERAHARDQERKARKKNK